MLRFEHLSLKVDAGGSARYEPFTANTNIGIQVLPSNCKPWAVQELNFRVDIEPPGSHFTAEFNRGI